MYKYNMPIRINMSLTQTATLISVLTPVVAGLIYLGSVIATKTQVAIVRNDAAIANNDTHIALMYLKYPAVLVNGVKTMPKLDDWSIQDQEKFKQLQEFKVAYDKQRKELSGIPMGLPQ